jgi:hypothetical protein
MWVRRLVRHCKDKLLNRLNNPRSCTDSTHAWHRGLFIALNNQAWLLDAFSPMACFLTTNEFPFASVSPQQKLAHA